jgi:hypothetical protein
MRTAAQKILTVTTEERLDKLAERVDAIARNVELLSGMQIETERKLQLLVDSIGRIRSAVVDHEDRIVNLENRAQ